MYRHVLPNIAEPLIVSLSFTLVFGLLTSAGLSFLGLGVRPPAASWGSMVQDGVALVDSAWRVAFFPGLAIALTSVAFNVLGDGLRDALDPRELDGQ